MGKVKNYYTDDDGNAIDKYGYFNVEYGEGEGEILIRCGTPKSTNPVFNAGLEEEITL